MDDLEVAQVFAANMKRHRKLAGLSQEELGFMASVHHTEISVLERSLRVPKISTAVRIANSLEVSMDELLEGISWRSGHYSPGKYRMSGSDEPSK
jgi:transcriptional regulator with XRE-family HTH domain